MPLPSKCAQRSLAALLVFFGCCFSAAETRAQDGSTEAPHADSKTANNAEFIAAADEVLQQMSEITGLKLLTPLKKSLRSDRKSTRLNSSHVEISYAVFCLKKKTKKINN